MLWGRLHGLRNFNKTGIIGFYIIVFHIPYSEVGSGKERECPSLSYLQHLLVPPHPQNILIGKTQW